MKKENLMGTEVVENKNTKNRLKQIILWSIVGFLLLSIILFTISSQNPDFPIKIIVIVLAVILILSGFTFGGFFLYKKFNVKTEVKDNKTGVPVASSQKEIELKLTEFILSKRNHIKRIVDIIPFSIGKNEIYAYNLDLLYEDGKNGKNVYVIINSNYINKTFSIVNADDITPSKLNRVANGMSMSPEVVDNEVTEEENPMLGTKRRITKTIHSKKENEKDIKPQEEVK
jgi:hypothetical protein